MVCTHAGHYMPLCAYGSFHTLSQQMKDTPHYLAGKHQSVDQFINYQFLQSCLAIKVYNSLPCIMHNPIPTWKGVHGVGIFIV